MLERYDTLAPRTQVGHYWIYDVSHISDDAVVYRAEDMRLNRDVLLKEFFPSSMARRRREEKGGYTVYALPTENSRFEHLKRVQTDVAGSLRWIDHPHVAPVSDLFEANGTVYTVYQPHTARPLYQGLERRHRYTEKEIVHFASSLTGALIALRKRGLAVAGLHASNMEIGRDARAVMGSRAELVPAEGRNDHETIRDFGLLMLTMMRGRRSGPGEKNGEMLPDTGYSPAILGLVKRMISGRKTEMPKNLEEIRTLLDGSHNAGRVVELVRHGMRRRPFSSPVGLGSLAAIVLLGAYMLFSHPKASELREISLFDTARYYLAAHLGVTDAQRMLGEMYERGYGVDRDTSKAVEWYYEAANAGDRYAQSSLGHLYERGIGVSKEERKAAYWFDQAAKRGDAVAQFKMGVLSSEGRVIAENTNAARLWFEKAALQLTESAESPQQSAELENGRLQYELAVMYLNGRTVSKNYDTAFRLARAAAAREHVPSFYLMGYLHQNGYGVGQNYRQAVKWYEKGAHRYSDRRSQAALGYLYMEGLGVPADPGTAVHWFRQAAEQGESHAQYALARAFEFGKGVAADSDTALQWYKKSAETGYSAAAEKVRLLTDKTYRRFGLFKATDSGGTASAVESAWYAMVETSAMRVGNLP